MNKYQAWWDGLPKHTQEYLKSQPLWHDRDLFKALAIGIAVGFVLGAVIV
jgi:hypothetical protein